MTISQQMKDCDGNQLNLFTNQHYNMLNGNSPQGYLKFVTINSVTGQKGVMVGAPGG